MDEVVTVTVVHMSKIDCGCKREHIRIHRGKMDQEARDAYLDGMDLPPIGTRIEFHVIDVYSDIGDGDVDAMAYELASDGWSEVP